MKRIKILKLTDNKVEALIDIKIYTVEKKEEETKTHNFFRLLIDGSIFKSYLLKLFGMYKVDKFITPEEIHLDFFDVSPTNYPFTEKKLLLISALYYVIGVDIKPKFNYKWLLKRINFDGPKEWLDKINEELNNSSIQ